MYYSRMKVKETEQVDEQHEEAEKGGLGVGGPALGACRSDI